MGRIKTKLIKRITKDLIKKYDTQLSPEFEKNKAVVDVSVSNKSKKIRNVIAGYAARLKRKQTSG